MVLLVRGWLFYHIFEGRILHPVLEHVEAELKTAKLETNSDGRNVKLERNFRCLHTLRLDSDSLGHEVSLLFLNRSFQLGLVFADSGQSGELKHEALQLIEVVSIVDI